MTAESGRGGRGAGAGGGGGRGGGGGGGGREGLLMFVDEKGRAQQTRPELREVISLPYGGNVLGDEVSLVLVTD